MLGSFYSDDQCITDLLGTGGSTASFARIVMYVEHRILEAAATHVFCAVQNCFPFTTVRTPFFLGRVFLHVEEALGVGVSLTFFDLLVARTEYYFEAGTRTRLRLADLSVRRSRRSL